jgi:hypothetical protein
MLAAWFLTGRKNSALRILAGVLGLIGFGVMFLKMLNGY